jgi:formylglycine-generating enzyme required for sulfatase activity
VLRGGSWLNNAILCHSAYRTRNWAIVRGEDIGFRVALVSGSVL